MEYLQTYKLFESDSSMPELSEQELKDDELYSYIGDICQELKDDGLEVRIKISDCSKVGNMLCDDVVSIWTNVPSSIDISNRINDIIEYSEIKETYDRLIEYFASKGYDNYELKRFNFEDGSIYLDFDGDENKKSESFKIEFYKSVNHIIESKTTSKLKFNKQPRKKGAKTDVYNVVKNGTTIGQVKWYSRLRGYGFLPPTGDEAEVKEFVKEVSRLRREEMKKNKKK